MDDDKDHDKTLIEKTLQTVKDIASTVSDAAKHVMEPDPVKPGEQPVAFVPMAGDGFADPMMMPVYAPKKRVAKKKTAKKAAKKASKKSAKKAAKKAPKKSKKAAKKTAKKTSKKVAKKKKVKKSKR